MRIATHTTTRRLHPDGWPEEWLLIGYILDNGLEVIPVSEFAKYTLYPTPESELSKDLNGQVNQICDRTEDYQTEGMFEKWLVEALLMPWRFKTPMGDEEYGYAWELCREFCKANSWAYMADTEDPLGYQN